MSTLLAIVFKHDEYGAENTLQKLRGPQNKYSVDQKTAVIARRGENGKVKLTQLVNLASSGAWHGTAWGFLIGLLFAGSLGWIIVGGIGAGFGGVSGVLKRLWN